MDESEADNGKGPKISSCNRIISIKNTQTQNGESWPGVIVVKKAVQKRGNLRALHYRAEAAERTTFDTRVGRGIGKLMHKTSAKPRRASLRASSVDGKPLKFHSRLMRQCPTRQKGT